jgi:hypothetical protein
MQRYLTRTAALAAVASITIGALAADHQDAPAAKAEPGADITDVFAWMSTDAKSVRIAVDVNPFAAVGSKFSDAVQYAIHVNSGTGATKTETLIVCEFATDQTIQCWLGDSEYVTGDASATAGLVTKSGKVKVFAGLRNDPFFFELKGFQNAVALADIALPTITDRTAGCPTIDMPSQAALLSRLTTDDTATPTPTPAKDTFDGANVLALVFEIDKTLFNPGTAPLGIWASTHVKN